MHAMLASFLCLGSGELLLVLMAVSLLFLLRRIPEILRDLSDGLWKGRKEFQKAIGTVLSDTDTAAHDAGRSLGGIYGKPAAQAITADNHVAELYAPAVFEEKNRSSRSKNVSRWRPLRFMHRAWSVTIDRVWMSLKTLWQFLFN
jgi:Sec-independent protein translocase protein TatA